MNQDAKVGYEVAGGLAAGAILSSFLLPGLGLVLGGGALAATLASRGAINSGPSQPLTSVKEILIRHGVDSTAAETMQNSVESSGAVVELDGRQFAPLSEAQVLQCVSDHGGRIAWGANADSPTLAHPGTA